MTRIAVLIGIGLISSVAGAQAVPPQATPTQAPPAPSSATPAATTSTSGAQTVVVTVQPRPPISREHMLANDWAQLGVYRLANAALPAAAAGERRVVFYGDSITQGWDLAKSFPGKPYINRGISGQTTQQMLVRFRPDVISLHPEVVVILAGTNDIAQNDGPETLEQIEDNFASMCELARANNIRVVLSSVLPVFDYTWRPGLQPVPKVAALNAWLRDYAAAHGEVYLDYFAAMQDERHGLPLTLSKDGVHPNPAGYAVMAPLAEKAIGEAESASENRETR